MKVHETAARWHEMFNRHAGDLYPGLYTEAHCLELAEQAAEIVALAAQKRSLIAVHNYLPPEAHELVELAKQAGLIGLVGDSLGLARDIQAAGAERVMYLSVYFMAATAKIIAGDKTRVFTCDTPDVLGCSLVFGTDHGWVDRWKKRNPGGILCTYINSDAALKAKSDYVTTSRNTADIVARALIDHPGVQILILPDKFLGWVMKAKALEKLTAEGLDATTLAMYEKRIEVYDTRFGVFNASCEVHDKIGPEALEKALETYPDADLVSHPECGCENACIFKLSAGIVPNDRTYVLSTEQMYWHAMKSPKREFIVGTEAGMLYRLRRDMPDRIFRPVSAKSMCRYMKANTLEKALATLREDKYETVFCEDCCDPKDPKVEGKTIHLPRSTAIAAKAAIDNMMAIG